MPKRTTRRLAGPFTPNGQLREVSLTVAAQRAVVEAGLVAVGPRLAVRPRIVDPEVVGDVAVVSERAIRSGPSIAAALGLRGCRAAGGRRSAVAAAVRRGCSRSRGDQQNRDHQTCGYREHCDESLHKTSFRFAPCDRWLRL